MLSMLAISDTAISNINFSVVLHYNILDLFTLYLRNKTLWDPSYEDRNA